MRCVQYESLPGLGADPTGYAPCVLGHEGAGVVERVGPGVALVAPGDHVITLFAPECGRCVHCLSGRTNRCTAIRDMQGQGYLPDGTTRLSRDGEPMRHFMGTSTFAEYTVMPEIALAKVSPEASLEGCAPFACGLATGIGAALYTADVQAGSTSSSSAVGSSGSVQSSGAGSPAPGGSSRSTSRRVVSRARVTTARPTRAARPRTPSTGSARRRTVSAPTTPSRRPATCASCGRPSRPPGGVGARDDGRHCGKGETLDIVPRFLITGRRVTGSWFGGVKGRTQVPQLLDRWLAGEIDVESLLSHRLTLDEVNREFELMEAPGRHPQRDRLFLT